MLLRTRGPRQLVTISPRATAEDAIVLLQKTGISQLPVLDDGKPVGGIDWGWRNPFAALWGQFDRDDVLWIRDERYLRTTPVAT